MKAQHLLLAIVSAPLAEGFSQSSTATFVKRTRPTSESHGPTTSTALRDMEGDEIDIASRRKLETLLKPRISLADQIQQQEETPIEEAEATHGMPWTQSIDKSLGDDALLYMDFWKWQMDFMKEHLTDLRVESIEPQEGMDFTFNENSKKKARIVNVCFSSKEYRKIRMTYYDAGTATQVFNSVWYPNPEHNLPILGIDLLAFNRKKYLAIVDFQPIHENEDDHAVKFEEVLKPIKESYDSLKGRMSSKFYDETQFFSQQMLFARFDDEGIVQKDLLPAFQDYVVTHVNMIKSTEPEPSKKRLVLERHQAYDSYSAERDPATGLFAAMFGQDWAEGFVHDFLFSLSERKEGGLAPFMPPMGGGGGGNPMAGGGNPHAAGRNPMAGNPMAATAPAR